MNRIKFVRGSEFQYTGVYLADILELSSRVTISAAKKAGTEVVKQSKDTKLGSALYPVMQAVDENYVGQATFGRQVDFELGGLEQRQIFHFSRDWDKIEGEPRQSGKITYLMTPIISLSKTGKMSCSDGRNPSKISFLDTDDEIRTKIERAFCIDKDVDCGLMKLLRCVFFPLHGKVIITDNYGPHEYVNYHTLQSYFVQGAVTSQQVKSVITTLMCDVVEPIRQYLHTDDMRDLITDAYPQ
jgi:tyrosyl-tRNA synthetase